MRFRYCGVVDRGRSECCSGFECAFGVCATSKNVCVTAPPRNMLSGKNFEMPLGESIGTPLASRTRIFRYTPCSSNSQEYVPARVRIRVDAGPQGHGVGLRLGGVWRQRGRVDLVAMMVANPGNASPDPTTGYYGKVMKHDAVRLMYHVLALLVCKARAWWSWQRMPELSTAQY